jgi:hypothetical protein
MDPGLGVDLKLRLYLHLACIGRSPRTDTPFHFFVFSPSSEICLSIELFEFVLGPQIAFIVDTMGGNNRHDWTLETGHCGDPIGDQSSFTWKFNLLSAWNTSSCHLGVSFPWRE